MKLEGFAMCMTEEQARFRQVMDPRSPFSSEDEIFMGPSQKLRSAAKGASSKRVFPRTWTAGASITSIDFSSVLTNQGPCLTGP